MTAHVQTGISLKIFIGFQINSEIRMHLNYSDAWKQHQVIRCADGTELKEVRHKEKSYVGFLLDNDTLTITEIGKIEQSVRDALQGYCPDLNTDHVGTYVISQLFLA